MYIGETLRRGKVLSGKRRVGKTSSSIYRSNEQYIVDCLAIGVCARNLYRDRKNVCGLPVLYTHDIKIYELEVAFYICNQSLVVVDQITVNQSINQKF